MKMTRSVCGFLRSICAMSQKAFLSQTSGCRIKKYGCKQVTLDVVSYSVLNHPRAKTWPRSGKVGWAAPKMSKTLAF